MSILDFNIKLLARGQQIILIFHIYIQEHFILVNANTFQNIFQLFWKSTKLFLLFWYINLLIDLIITGALPGLPAQPACWACWPAINNISYYVNVHTDAIYYNTQAAQQCAILRYLYHGSYHKTHSTFSLPGIVLFLWYY